jgi:hypothetical protein
MTSRDGTVVLDMPSPGKIVAPAGSLPEAYTCVRPLQPPFKLKFGPRNCPDQVRNGKAVT